MAIVLYDLAGAEEDRRFSPFCWRSRMALAHKGLAVETRPWRFTDKAAIAFSGQGKVPVLVDGDRSVVDSWTIAEYLDEAYPDRPPLMAGPGERALSRFVASWADTVLNPALLRLLALDIHGHLDPGDQAYFRETREARFGTTLEALCADREARLPGIRDTLAPLRRTLEAQPYLHGAAPGYADYIVFGAFQWARCISPLKLLAPEDPVAAWRRRLLDAFDGLAAAARGYPC